MNRSTKRTTKVNNSLDSKKGNTIHSGSFMTSYLHDDDHTEFNNEMPIASPDALKFDDLNEVPVIALKNQEEDMNEVNKKAKEVDVSTDMSVLMTESAKGVDIGQSIKLDRNGNEKPEYNKQISSSRTISGGLTLNNTNASLKNLIIYIKTAYSNNLTSPKWKNFKGLKLQVVEKIRLNNVIWRTWFEQYGYNRKQSPNKKKPSLLCQFTVKPDLEKVHARTSKQDGEYWKRRLGSITNEYKKWRTISRKHVKLNEADSPTSTSVKPIAYDTDNQSKFNTNMTTNTSVNYFDGSNINLSSMSGGFHPSGNSYNSYCDSSNNNISHNVSYVESGQIHGPGEGFYDAETYTNSNYMCNNITNDNNNASNTSSTFNSNTHQSYLYNQNSLGQSVGGQQPQLNQNQINNHPIVYSKQVPFTNRCRSPSPGLFKDIDMFNFSSDTLFGTNYISDHKDPIFGNNPDLFQPDLMHLYPNFDFFNLEYELDTELTGSNTNHSNSQHSNTNQSPNDLNTFTQQQSQISQQLSNHSSPNGFVPQNIAYSSVSNNNPASTNSGNQVVFDQNGIEHQNQYTVDLTDNLYNLANLANAAATLPNLSQSIDTHIDQGVKIHNRKSEFKKLTNAGKMDQIQGPLRSTSHNINSHLHDHPNKHQHYQDRIANDHGAENHSSVNVNSSNNTIRNLLAQQHSTQQISSNNIVNGSSQAITNNICVSGVYSSMSGPPPTQVFANQDATSKKYQHIQNHHHHQQQQQQQQLYSQGSSNNLLSDYHYQMKKSKNIPKISNPELENNPKYKNQQMSVLLSAVLAPSLENPAKQGSKILLDPVKKSKRGRKNSTKNSNDINQGSDTEPPQTKKPIKLKKPTNATESDDKMPGNNHMFAQDNLIQSSNKQIKSGLNSLTNSPKVNINGRLSNEVAFSRYNSVISTTTPDSTSRDGNYTSMDTFSRPSMNNTKLAEFLNDSSSPTPISRSRSSSINNNNNSYPGEQADNQGLTTAEQKRRCNIQSGFDRLQTLVPSLKDPKNSKASKATMLKKTSEYIKELQIAREKRLADLAVYQKEIEELSNKVTECQIALPVGGVSLTGGLNKSEVMEKKFRSWVEERTAQNWKFYLFSLIIRPLFENFVGMLNTSSKEEMEKTFLEWQEKYCSLVQLRPIVSNYLRQISKSTSILSDCSKLPEECYIAALKNP